MKIVPRAEVFRNPHHWVTGHARPLGDESMAYLSIPKTGSTCIRDSIGEQYLKNQFVEKYDRMFAVIRDPYQRLVSGLKTCHWRLIERLDLSRNQHIIDFDLDYWLDRFDRRDFRWIYDEHLVRQRDFLPGNANIDLFGFEHQRTEVPKWFRRYGFDEIAVRFEYMYDLNSITVYNIDNRVIDIVENYYAGDLTLYESVV